MENLSFTQRFVFAGFISLLLFCHSVNALTFNPVSAGQVRFFNNANWEFDPFIDSASSTDQQWMKSHYYRMLVHAPYFDTENAWYPGGLAYFDSYAIYVDDPIVLTHPDWIMRDAQGNKLFIPWACQNGSCTQYAGDFSNPAFRQYRIQEMSTALAQGYKGLWLDDVNFTWRVGNGNGDFIAPIDKNTGKAMTLDGWRSYLAQYMEQIRSTFPNNEITHNTIWFADAVDAQNPYINREIDAADYINLERGGNDDGLVGGTGEWSYSTFLKFVDYVHGRGADVIMMDIGTNAPELEYGMATWLLISQGNDLLGNNADNKLAWSAPNSWWTGYDSNLGNASGARYTWNNLLRRDFTCGLVLANEPEAATKTVSVGSGYKNLAGQVVTSVTLAAKQAAVLKKTCTTTTVVTPPQPVVNPPVLKNFQQGLNGYAGAKDVTIYSASPTRNLGSASTLGMQGTQRRSSLMAWDLTQIPVTAKIQKVDITFNTMNASVNNFAIYDIKQPWVESQASWNNYATGKTWVSVGAASVSDRGTTSLGVFSSRALGTYTLTLNTAGLALVQNWVKNPATNRGIIFDDNLAADLATVSSKEDANVNNRPKLSVTYTMP